MLGKLRCARADTYVEIVGEALAHLGACLARDREELCLVVFRKRRFETGVPISDGFPRIGRMGGTQFDRRGAEPEGQFLRSIAQAGHGSVILREHAATHGEAARHQRAAEQGRMDIRQRQPPADLPRLLTQQAIGLLPCPALDRGEPERSVEYGAAGFRNECLDPRELVAIR